MLEPTNLSCFFSIWSFEPNMNQRLNNLQPKVCRGIAGETILFVVIYGILNLL